MKLKKKKVSFQSQWIKVRKIALERDGNKCCVCGAESKYLNVHHICSKKYYKQHALEVDNLISLCPRCHTFSKKSAHSNSLWFSEWLKLNRPQQFEWAMNVIENEN